jgi:hypothetical protein
MEGRMTEYLPLAGAFVTGATLATIIGYLLLKRGANLKAAGTLNLSGVTWSVEFVETSPTTGLLQLVESGDGTAKLGVPRVAQADMTIRR